MRRRRIARICPDGSLRALVHDQRITYRTGGSGPVVLLIHGVAGSATTWWQAMPGLTVRFTVSAPELLGHGRSDKPEGD